MVESLKLVARKLDDSANISGFTCGRQRYDQYLCQEAREDQKARVGQVWLFYHEDSVVGYVSLAMSQLNKNDHQKLGAITAHGYVPGLLLGQMARHVKYRGHGIGQQMLNWVIMQGVQLSERVGCRLVILQSEEDKVDFYKDTGFIPIPNRKKKKNIMFMNLQPYFEPLDPADD